MPTELPEAVPETQARQQQEGLRKLPIFGKPLLTSGAWALFDNTLISGTNFLTALLMARAVAPSQFGVFMMAYAGLWLLQNIQRVLIAEPMSVLIAKTDGDEYRSYVSGTAFAQAGFALIVGGGLVIAAFVSPVESLLLAMALAAVFWQLQEFVRRVFYARLQVAAAATNDVVSYGGQAAAMTGLYLSGELSPVTALLAIAATSAVAAAIGGWQVRRDIIAMPGVRGAWKSMTRNWEFGRWLLGAQLLREVSDRLYTVLLVLFAGPAGVGAFVAAGTLARITNSMVNALETLLPPVASRLLRQESRLDMEKVLRWATFIGGAAQVVFVALILIFAEGILRVTYGDRYAEFASVLRIMSIAFFLRFLALPLRTGLRSVEETQALFLVGAASAVFFVTGGALLAAIGGVTGAALAVLIKHSISLVTLKIQYRRVTRRVQAPDAAA